MRISTTTLESFRLWLEPEQEWMTEDDLLATIRGQVVPNHKMLVGTAYGSVLETPAPFRILGGYRVGDIVLGDDVMGPALATIAPDTIFEAKGIKRYGEHDVVAKADQMRGNRIRETKATLSSFDVEKYLASCQWRFMLDIFGAASVEYQVACLYESEANGTIEFRSLEQFRVYPYPALSQECAALVQQFDDYVTVKGLRGLLDARQVAA